MTGINDLWLLAAAVLIWLAYATYVVILIRNSGQYENAQLTSQTILAFLLPFLGAIFVHFMFLATRAKEPKADRHHTRQEHEVDGALFGRNKQADDE
jgi:hypothetical protein